MSKKSKKKVPERERYRLYEALKRRVAAMGLNHKEYEERVRRIADALGV